MCVNAEAATEAGGAQHTATRKARLQRPTRESRAHSALPKKKMYLFMQRSQKDTDVFTNNTIYTYAYVYLPNHIFLLMRLGHILLCNRLIYLFMQRSQ